MTPDEDLEALRRGLALLYPTLEVMIPGLLGLDLKLDTPFIAIHLQVTPESRFSIPDLSRSVSYVLGLPSYSLHITTLPPSPSSRIFSILNSQPPCNRGPTFMRRPHVYVIFGFSPTKRIPLGSFESRTQAEHALESGLLKSSLEGYGLDMARCEYYTVDRWTVGELLEEPYVKLLTKYDSEGNVLLRLPEEGKKSGPVSGRLLSILAGPEGLLGEGS